MSGCIPAWPGVPGSVRKVKRSGSSDNRLYCCLFNLCVAGSCSPSKVRLGTLWPTFPQATPRLIPHLCSQHPQLPSKGGGDRALCHSLPPGWLWLCSAPPEFWEDEEQVSPTFHPQQAVPTPSPLFLGAQHQEMVPCIPPERKVTLWIGQNKKSIFPTG